MTHLHRDDLDRHALNVLVRISILALASFVLVFGVPGCTIKTSEDSTQGATGPRDIPAHACGDMLEGTIIATDELRASTQVARYDYRLDSAAHTITFDLYDGGDQSLGHIVIQFDHAFSERIVFTTDVRYERAGAEVASQHTRTQLVNGAVATFTRHEVGNQHALLWAEIVLQDEATSADAFQVSSLTLGAPAVAGETEPTLPIDGKKYRASTVLTDGGTLDAGAVREFMTAAGLDSLSSNADFERMVKISEDAGWRDDAAHGLRGCAAAEVDGAEGLLTQSATHPVSLGQVQQAADCASQESPFAKVIKIESMLGAIVTGETLTGILITAGVVSGGWAILGALAVTTVASYVILGKLETAIQNEAKNAPGIRDLANLGNDGSGGGSSGGGSGSRGAGSRGDPHLHTFDGLNYDFQGAGEYVLFEATAGPSLTVQVRQEPVGGICSSVAVNTAVATEIGNVRVHLDGESTRGFLLDGVAATVPGSTLLFPNGDTVERDGGTVTLSWASGEKVTVHGVGNTRALGIDAALPAARLGQVRGLLGTYDGDRSNELGLRDGSTLSEPVEWEELMTFGESFRIGSAESLFTYAPGQSTDDYAIEGFPSGPIGLADLPPDVRATAEQTCVDAGIENEVALSNCILDVGCTGDPAFADDFVGVEGDQTLAVSAPIEFTDWVVEGDGIWDVQPDGRSVIQRRNGNPTFYLSSQEYLNVQITGTLLVDGGDDDYIGFVFGYRKPLTAAGDEPNDLVTQILSWKSREQNVYGTAYEGFTLSRATGMVDPLEEILWRHEEGPTYEVLGTDYGDGRGWEQNVTYGFKLTYTASMVEISVNDAVIFSVPASESGAPFEAGRFGFYNYSQAGVTYADFFATPLP